MKVLLQRVSRASVTVEGRRVAGIAGGLLLLVGVETGDREDEAHAAADKVLALRIFGGEDGRMDLDVRDVGGEILVVSQFTLAGSVRKGRRPSFDGAAAPEVARHLLERLVARLQAGGITVGQGVFGAHMDVELVNDGPVTFLVEVRNPSLER